MLCKTVVALWIEPKPRKLAANQPGLYLVKLPYPKFAGWTCGIAALFLASCIQVSGQEAARTFKAEPSITVQVSDKRLDANGNPVDLSANFKIPERCFLRSMQKRNRVVIPAVAAGVPCFTQGNRSDLIVAMKSEPVVFELVHESRQKLQREQANRGFEKFVGEEFHLQQWQYDLKNSTRKSSPMVYVDASGSTSLIQIWCYANSQKDWLCQLFSQPRSNVVANAKIRFSDLHLWRDLVVDIDRFVADNVSD